MQKRVKSFGRTLSSLAVFLALAPSALNATHPRVQCYADCRAIRNERMRQLRHSAAGGPLSADDRRDLARLRRQTYDEHLQCRRDCRTPERTTPECDAQCSMWTDALARLEENVRMMGPHMSRDDRVDIANLRTSIDSNLRSCRRNCMSGSGQGDSFGNCPAGQHAVATNNAFEPYRCASTGQGSGSGQSGRFGNCPAGQHVVATNNAFEPYRCVANGP